MAPYTRFFTTTGGVRIAYATLGAGPPVIYLPPFLSHIELMWEAPAYRAFNEALAEDFTLVRYDRYGCGLSDRDRNDFSLAVDVDVLAEMVDHLRLRRFALLGFSAGALVAVQYAVAFPQRVSRLVLFGMNLRRPGSPVRAAVDALIRADVRLGTNALADYLLPDADPDALAWLARINRESASAEMTVGLAGVGATVDVAALLPRVRVPTLVLHRRGDRLAPVDGAREIAALVPGARFAALPGDAHIAEFGEPDAVVRAIHDFVAASSGRHGSAVSAPEAGAGRPPGVSAREAEVLGLIAAGLTNREIAERLSLSVHTVERHATTLYLKLGVRGRSEATAYALRRLSVTPIPSAT